MSSNGNAVGVLNTQCKFNAPKAKAVVHSILREYARGTAVRIKGEWYVVIRDCSTAILLNKDYTLVSMPGNTEVEVAGYASIDIMEY